MASMKLTFSEAYTKVSEFLGLGSTPTGADLTLCKDLVFRGYRQFLFPIDMATRRGYTWSFRKQEGSIVARSGIWEYELPEDFGRFIRRPEFANGASYPFLTEITVSRIMSLRNINSTNSYPKYFAIRLGKYALDNGQRIELLLYETPNGTYPLNFTYLIEPQKPNDDTDVFLGGALASECVLECALAAAEQQEDEKEGVHTKLAARLLQQLLAEDKQRSPASVGEMRDTGVRRTVDFRQWQIPDKLTTAYGIS